MRVRQRPRLRPSRYWGRTQTRGRQLRVPLVGRRQQDLRPPSLRSPCSRSKGPGARTGRRSSCRSSTSVTVGCCPTAKTASTSSTGRSGATLWASSTFSPSIIGGRNWSACGKVSVTLGGSSPQSVPPNTHAGSVSGSRRTRTEQLFFRLKNNVITV